MHHYPHNIGDFRKDTPHLSPSEKGIYRDLLDYAYATEKPLPDDLDMLCRVTGAVRGPERVLVGKLLAEFFTRCTHGWEHKRVIKEIRKYYAKSDAGKLGADAKHYGKQHGKDAGELDAIESSKQHGKDAGERTSNHKRARNQEPSTNNQEPSTIGAVSAIAADVDPVLLEEPPITEKKEGGRAEVWLDVESDEARRVVNRALGRDERRAFVPRELAALHLFAAQHDGMICPAHFDDDLRPYLMAAPRYDQPALAGWTALPQESLLLKRKRYASNVLEELANQLDFARVWKAAAQKKERAVAEIPTPEEDVPPGGWRAAWQELYEFSPPDTWAEVPSANRADVRLWLNTNTNKDQTR